MNKERIKDFQNRIVNAGRGELLIINYEMLLAQLDEIGATLEQDRQLLDKEINTAQKILRELIDALDFQYPLAKELMAIYIYVNKKLIDVSIKRQPADVTEIYKVIKLLLEGWEKTDYKNDKPVMENGQKVFAGLTYGKKSLNETSISSSNRGLKA